MKLRSLYLKNFRTIKEEKLEFKDGLTVLSGDNGQGKSSFLIAISLVYFDRFPGTLADLVRWDQPNSAFVKSEFELFGKEYIIEIEIFNEGGSSRLLKDISDGMEYRNSAAKEKMNELIDSKRAIASIASFQHEIDLITTSPSVRREYLKNVYDLTFKKELNQIDKDNKEFQEKEISLAGEIKILSSQTFEKQSLSRLPSEESILEKENLLRSEQGDKGDWLKLESTQKEEFAKINQTKQEIESLENKLLKISSDIVIKKDEHHVKGLELENSKELDLESFNEKRSALETSIKNNISKIDETSKSLKETMDQSSKELALYKADYSEKVHLALKEEVVKFQKEKTLVESKLKNIQSGKCPTCGAEYSSGDISSLEQEAERIEMSLSNAIYEENRFSTIKDNIGKTELDIAMLETKIKSQSSDKQIAEKHLSDGLKQIELDIEKEERFYKLQQESLKKDLAHIEETMASLEEKKTETLTQIENLKKSLGDPSAIMEKITRAQVKIEECNSKILELESFLENYRKTKTENETKKKFNKEIELKEKKRDEDLKQAEKDYKEATIGVQKTKEAKDILSRGFPSFVLSRLISDLEVHANNFLREIYPKFQLKFKEEGKTLAVLYGNDVDVKQSSGFEQQIFSFAYKYALGVVQQYNLLLLDEVDSAASEKNSKLFYETLSKMSSMFEQIIVITHKEGTKDLLKNDFKAEVFEIEDGSIRRAE
jgi:exonuclease SbcC